MEPIPFLQKLVTEKTPILDLKNDVSISDEQKYQVLGLSPNDKSNQYITYMYYQNRKWYYFKKEEKNYGYPFYLLNELVGSYLAKSIELPTISFQVAKADNFLGIASENFRKDEFDYCFFEELPVKDLLRDKWNTENLESIKSLCINSTNESQLEEHILKLLALDLYMLQKDRGNVNLQFQINRITKYFDLASIYDFANCVDKGDAASITIPNRIVALKYSTIISLIKKYPLFSKYLSDLLDQTMSKTWNQICEDYHFNQNCYAYEQAKEYYEIKDKNQKQLLKEFLKN